ncbi:carbohydrate esterase family 9 protein [Amylostereum chailletii]|nr:carbohydrate esterase family 9 protein [Amylostereum chailletii]
MEKLDGLPIPAGAAAPSNASRPRGRIARWAGLLILLSAVQMLVFSDSSPSLARVPIHAQETLNKCRSHSLLPGPTQSFHHRTKSDRHVPGTPATLIRNAKIWTGVENGTEVIKGDVFLEDGLIKGVGHIGSFDRLTEMELDRLQATGKLKVIDAKGAWVTPGIVDNHSHLGVFSAPSLSGSADTNSFKGPILPWLRSLDALNTHDDAYALSIAGGVTTALVLPGSANAIGGQAFTIKLRKTAERSPTSMLVDPPYNLNGTHLDDDHPPTWRHMKHACGENPSRVYSATRMDTFWAFRQAYDTARQIKEKQDVYCSRALSGQWADLGDYPEDLQWEALVDVLRGRVKVQAHCYEAVDLDDLIRLTNEFQFPIAAVHHAHEAYLVPDVLKRAYGHPPAAAIFAVNGRYKREAYRGSEFAPRILADNGIQVVMKSDHPVLNSRYLLFEAQQAYYYGLPENLALASVITTPAQVIGLDHRVGYIKKGWDADLVIWDSHPLALGATPVQVVIDGVLQLDSPYTLHKPETFQSSPEVPNFDREVEETLKYDGLPPLLPNKSEANTILFTNVKSVILPRLDTLQEAFSAQEEMGVAIVKDGSLVCHGVPSTCVVDDFLAADDSLRVIDLQGGALSPGLTSFGSDLGLSEIRGEASTRDGIVFDPLSGPVPKIVGGDNALIRAVDGLQFAGRDALLAYRSGVTKAISAPVGASTGFLQGLGTLFSLGAEHKLESGAVVQKVTALHVSVGHGGRASISTQVAALRKILLALPEDTDATELGQSVASVVRGVLPIVVHADSADVIATLILLKREAEEKTGARIRMTVAGAAEAHILATELAQADIGVIVAPSRPFPSAWEQERFLPGPPLSKDSAISKLLSHGVTVGVGIVEAWQARNTRLDIAWAALESGGGISKTEALALASTNLEKLLGAETQVDSADLVVTAGGDLLELGSKVVGVVSSRRGIVELF